MYIFAAVVFMGNLGFGSTSIKVLRRVQVVVTFFFVFLIRMLDCNKYSWPIAVINQICVITKIGSNFRI